MTEKIRILVVLLALSAAVVGVYGRVPQFGFVSIDDTTYVSENDMVTGGLTGEGIRWALTTRHAANWHPITWLSLMFDCQLFGPDPGALHRTNMLLHLANTLLLFALWWSMTGNLWPSAVVAAIFAVHPLHVESVAWIAERKDVLSTFFGLLSLLSYVRYTRRPSAAAYGGALFFLGIGLGAKATLVTWPFVFLLLDFWPLNRWKTLRLPAAQNASPRRSRSATPTVLVLEKLPFLLASLAASVLVFRAQQQGWAVISLEAMPLDARLFNVIVNYAAYAAKSLFPYPLSVYYPHPGYSLPLWQIVGAAGLLAAVSGLVLKNASARPYLFVGWSWYLGTLVPVVGLVQLASQAMADRYAYVPQVGLTVMLAWGAAEVVGRRPSLRKPLAAAMGAFVVLMMGQARLQVGVWKDSPTLLNHAKEAVSDNWPVFNKLGVEMLQRNRIDEAASLFEAALRLHPDFDQAHQNLGIVMAKKGNWRLAEFHLRRAAALNQRSAIHRFNLGRFLYERGKVEEAIGEFAAAIALDPSFQPAVKALQRLGGSTPPREAALSGRGRQPVSGAEILRCT